MLKEKPLESSNSMLICALLRLFLLKVSLRRACLSQPQVADEAEGATTQDIPRRSLLDVPCLRSTSRVLAGAGNGDVKFEIVTGQPPIESCNRVIFEGKCD